MKTSAWRNGGSDAFGNMLGNFMSDKKVEDAEKRLKPLLTDYALEIMRLACKTCGNSVDHVESAAFVAWCFELAEKPKPDTEPFGDN